jgi:hypothetical protein
VIREVSNLKLEHIVDLIVEEVMERLKYKEKRALIIFTGGSIGFNESIIQIKKLMRANWTFKVLMSKSAEYVLTPRLIKEQLNIEDMYIEGKIKDISSILKDVGKIIIPVLTLNSAAKIALGISDTLPTYLVSSGIMKGIPIIAAKDACDLGNSTRGKLGYSNIPLAYKRRMEKYLDILKEYGIHLINIDELFNVIEGSKYEIKDIENKVMNREDRVKLDKKIITREDIVKLKGKTKKIIIHKGAIVTSLAEDIAKNVGIMIIKEN